MLILMTNNSLDERAGSESYLETVATELRRLGHEVVFFSPRCGDLAVALRKDGYPVHDDVADVPKDVDVIHGQHVSAVGPVRDRLPRTPLVFVTHSWLINPVEDPVAGLRAAAYVALNDLTLRRLRAHAATSGAPVHRLTQPVQVSFGDAARVPVSAVPRRAVAVSRRMKTLPGRLAKACAELGIEFHWVGAPQAESADARHEMFAADLVVAIGRSALEAMAAARPVLVMDESVTAGWVTEASYPALEADGLTGFEAPRGEPDLLRLLEGYDAGLGTVARQLVMRHHTAQDHATRLVEIYTSAADSRAAVEPVTTPPPDLGSSLAGLAADRLGLELRLRDAEWKRAAATRELDAANIERDRLAGELELSQAHVQELIADLATVRAQRDRARQRRRRTARRLDEALAELVGPRQRSVRGEWLRPRRSR